MTCPGQLVSSRIEAKLPFFSVVETKHQTRATEHPIGEFYPKPPVGYSNADSWAPPTESDSEGSAPGIPSNFYEC